MPSEVAHLVDADQTFPVIRLSGVLDSATAAEVRSTLLSVLATQPQALAVDVSSVGLAEPAATLVLRDVARDTAEWPAAPIVLIAAREGETWAGTGLPIHPDRDAALAAFIAAPPGDRRDLALEPVVGAARRARELITAACASWNLPEVSGSACIVATEMVNNVVAHARTAMTVLLARHGDAIRVAVRDRSGTIPRFSGPVAPTSYGGRGLVLIDSVSDRWGSLVLPDGKVVWSVLSLEKEQAGETRIADRARG